MYHLIQVLTKNGDVVSVWHHASSSSKEALKTMSQDPVVKSMRIGLLAGGTGWQKQDNGSEKLVVELQNDHKNTFFIAHDGSQGFSTSPG